MKSYLFIVVVLAVSLALFGCGKKDTSMEGSIEPMSMEALTAPTGTTVSLTETPQVTAAPTSTKLEPLPPAGPYRPSAKEIQEALKNANFYTGEVDGKIGPKTKKAIEEFQKANGLNPDGKVGTKTWAVLGKYLTQAAVPATGTKR